MTPLSEKIFADCQVRKTRKQKTAFIEFLQSKIPDMRVEQGGFGRNRNLVIGDISSAKVIFTAHYDTCARLPVPNFIAPKNIFLSFGYALLLCIPFFVLMGLLDVLLMMLTHNFYLAYLGSFIPSMALMFYLLMGGKPNPHTANDNTSGVITLCELIAAMTEEEKARSAFVFFDNEENGLLGSSFFRKLHKKDGLEKTLLLNFDCVSDGDHILFVQNRRTRTAHGEAMAASFRSSDTKTVYFESASTTMYPSDQRNFPMGVGVASLKKKKFIGLYMNKIHTVKDTVFQEENISFLVDGSRKLVNNLQNP